MLLRKKLPYDFIKCINTTMLYAIFVYTAGHLQKNDYVVATERHCSTLSYRQEHLTDDALFLLPISLSIFLFTLLYFSIMSKTYLKRFAFKWECI